MSHDPTSPLGEAERAALRTVLELLADERASVSSVVEPDQGWKVHVADSLTGLEFDEPPRREADRRYRRRRRLPRPAARRRAAHGGGRPDRVGRPQVRASSSARSRPPGSAMRGSSTPARRIGRRREGRAGRPTKRSRRAPSAGSRPWPSWPRRCCARAGCWSPGRGAGTRTRRRRPPAPRTRLAMEAERVLDVGPYAGSRNRHLHLLRKTGPTPSDLPRRPGMAKKRPRG